jgi:hypothetical protein
LCFVAGKNITCPHHKSNIYCSSIHRGIVQDCVNDDIAGGWVSCMDIDEPCPINNYWINKDTVYVKDGCGGRINLCYTRGKVKRSRPICCILFSFYCYFPKYITDMECIAIVREDG